MPFLIVLAVILAIGLLVWIGLTVPPAPFPPYRQRTPQIKTIPLPQGLPAPVERFYRTAFGGERVPVIDTAVFTGRGRIRPVIKGPALNARFIFIHRAGKDYRHYFEATLFGLPLLKVNEGILNGKSFFESPMGNNHNDPNTNQGANLALWAEAGWFPSIWITDPRARWEPVDDRTARLYVPFENGEETFVVRFNPQTGLIDMMEAMRFRAPEDKNKILWITQNQGKKTIPGTELSTGGSAMWLDHGKPWATFELQDVVYNVDIEETIQRRGR